MPKRKRENSEYDDNVTVSLHNKRKKFNDVFTFFLPIIAEAVISGYGVNKKQKDYLPLSTSQYRTVKRNIYRDAKKMMERPTKCDACLDTEEKKCSSQICENHSLRWCCPRSCKCFNTKAHVSKPGYQLVVKQTGTTGLGLFTKQNIPANKFICEYLASIGKNQVIDATRFGSVARHANSSHEPNAIIEVWNINGLPKLYLFSLKLIKADSEITFFYNLQMLGTEKRQECFCGSTRCSGFLDTKPLRKPK